MKLFAIDNKSECVFIILSNLNESARIEIVESRRILSAIEY